MKGVLFDVYEVRPRKDRRGVNLISDAPPFGRLWYGEPNTIPMRDQKSTAPTPIGMKGGCSPEQSWKISKG